MPVLNVEQDFDFDTGQWRDAPAATATAADVHAQEPAHVQGAPPLSTPQRLVLEELLTELETRTMERPHGGLRLFIERAWPILDPATPFVGGWYIDAIAEHLTAVSRGELRDLIILMPPRFGKPVHEDAWVVLRRGRTQLKDVVVGDEILTHRNRFRRVLAVYEQGVLPLLQMTAFSGRRVCTAGDHPFLTTRGWVQARDLVPQLQYAGQTSRSTSEGDRLAYLGTGFDCPAGSAPATAEEARLLGYLVGDGSTKFSAICITNGDIEVLSDVLHTVEAVGMRVSQIRRKKAVKFSSAPARPIDAWTISLAGPDPNWRQRESRKERGPLQQWLIRHGLLGAGSHTKRVPAAILQAPNAIVAEFVGAYWACDGCLQHKGRNRNDFHVTAVTVSPGLADDLQHLLLRLGIRARVRRSVKQITRTPRNMHKGTAYPVYTLNIETQHDMRLFVERVPIHHSTKGAALAALRRLEFERPALLPDVLTDVSPAGEGRCRCLSVEEDETFTANDLVVHNSKIVAVYWPCWEWGPANLPHYRWLFNTYTLSLTLRDSAYRRQVMESAWYRRRWGSRFTLGKERFRPDTASKYENNHSGFHFATSVGGSNTGEGGHRVVVDDSLGAQDAYSESARETVIRWWTVVMPSRRNDDSSARIIVQQRLHERDLAGFLMKEEGGYTVLSLPNEYDPARPCVTRWFRDPRTEAGELLCPGRVSRAQTEELKSPTLGLGEADYAHQYQQLAVPEGGGIWKQAWWRYWVPRFHPLANTLDEHGHLIVALPPQFDRRIHTWDMTFKKTAGGSFVSGMAWGKRQAAAYLLGVYRERVGFVDTLQAVRNLLRAHPAHAVYVEGKANGPAVIDVLRLEIPGLIESKTERGKEEYAHAASPHVEAGNYVLPHPSLYPWVAPCLQRICAFPNAQFDDEVDTITQADRQLFIQQPFDARRFAQGSDHGI